MSDIIRLKKRGSILVESIVSLVIFVVISISIGNFIIGSVNYIISNGKISNNVLKIRELDVFLNSEFNENAFDFKVKSGSRLTYKKISTVNLSQCEIKQRDISFKNGSIKLTYDNRNSTNLLRGVDRFDVYESGNLIFVKILLGDITLTKIISPMSYSI